MINYLILVHVSFIELEGIIALRARSWKPIALLMYSDAISM